MISHGKISSSATHLFTRKRSLQHDYTRQQSYILSYSHLRQGYRGQQEGFCQAQPSPSAPEELLPSSAQTSTQLQFEADLALFSFYPPPTRADK